MSHAHCYMCSAVATSREHVPPKNLFPEPKDVSGANYRNNLITVPSCTLHNAAKSNDDEFLMVSLAGIIGNNSIGYIHKLGKVDRAVRRTANRLLDQVLIEKKEVFRVEANPNMFYDVIWGTPDVKRLHSCFEHIGYGLHWHNFGKRFDGEIKVLLGYLFHRDHNQKTWVNFIKEKSEVDLKDKPKLGDNPDVFYYQVSDPDEFKLFLIKLTFYGGLNVYLSLRPKNAKVPKNFAMELMARGITTIINVGEKSFEFNPRNQS